MRCGRPGCRFVRPDEIRRTADDVIEIATGDVRHARILAEGLRTAGIAEDVVAGLDSVAVRFDPLLVDENAIVAAIEAVPLRERDDGGDCIDIPVVYDGADLDTVCARLGCSKAGFIEQHSASEHRVELLGFVPGFAYVSGFETGRAVPRLAEPRQRVAAGSVGVANGFTGIYALAGPGGWPVVGHTKTRLFEPGATNPFRLRPGSRIRFSSASA